MAAQIKQKVSDEDERIHLAVEEAEEKRAHEESFKEAKLKKMIGESAEHRDKQVFLGFTHIFHVLTVDNLKFEFHFCLRNMFSLNDICRQKIN